MTRNTGLAPNSAVLLLPPARRRRQWLQPKTVLKGLVLRREVTLKISDEIKMAGGLPRQGCGLCCWSWRW
jgi:hypothetical protein